LKNYKTSPAHYTALLTTYIIPLIVTHHRAFAIRTPWTLLRVYWRGRWLLRYRRSGTG